MSEYLPSPLINGATAVNSSMSGQSAATADTSPPQLIAKPEDGQGADAPLVFVFSEPVKLGTGTIKLSSNNGNVYTGSLAGNPYVTVSGNTISFDPPQRLAYVTFYWVTISASGVTDLAGNPFDQVWADFMSEFSPVALNLTGTSNGDTLKGSNLADTMDGGDGRDTLYGYGGDDVLTGGDEYVRTSEYFLSGDTIEGGAGNDTLYGGAGQDTLRGGDGNDRLYGGADGDGLHGDAGDDVLDGGAGNDWLYGGSGNNTVLGGDGDDSLNAEKGSSGTLDGGSGNDFLYGFSGTTYDGGAGHDSFSLSFTPGSVGTTVVRGGDGNDSMLLTSYSDIQAQVTLSGGSGTDTYQLKHTAMSTSRLTMTVTDFDLGPGGDVIDLLLLPGLQPGVNPFDSGLLRLQASAAGALLQLRHPVHATQYSTMLTLEGIQAAQLTGASFTAGIDPRGGTTGITLTGSAGNDSLTGMLLDDTLLGLDGNDRLIGTGGNDLLDGGAGDDVLDGGAGSGTLRGGDGDDTLFFQSGQSATRTVVLAGDNGADILNIGNSAGQATVLASGGAGNDRFVITGFAGDAGVTITDFTAGDQIDLRSFLTGGNISGNPFGAAGYFKAVQEGSAVRIYVDQDGAAGTNWNFRRAASLDNTQLGMLGAASFAGNHDPSGSDRGLTLNGTPGADALSGQSLDDTIDGGDGADSIQGGAGKDLLRGGAGSDTLEGGAGDDRLEGGDGRDVLVDNEGGDYLSGGTGDDVLRSIGGSQDAPAASVLDGGSGHDRMEAGSTVRIVLGGAGDDALVVDARASAANTVTMEVDMGDGKDTVSFEARSGDARAVRVSGGADSDSYYFGPGERWTLATILDFQAGAGGDVLDIFSFLYPGNDLGGNPFGAAGHARLVQDGKHVLFQLDWDGAGGPQGFATRVVFENTNVADFSGDNFPEGARPDGSQGGLTISGTAASETLQGARFDDSIRGEAGDDTLSGGLGNDRLEGGAGLDTLDGGYGDDELLGGAGNDRLVDSRGSNILRGGDGDDQLEGSSDGRSQLFGDAGNDVLTAVRGGNLLDGGAGDDRLRITGSLADIHGYPSNAQDTEAHGGEGMDTLVTTFTSVAPASTVVLSGGAGIDTFAPSSISYASTVTVTDFTAGMGGDLLDVALLVRPTAGNPFATGGSVRLVQRGTDAVLQSLVDTGAFADVLVLRDVDKDTLTPYNIVHGFNPDGSSTGLSLAGSSGADRLDGGWLDDRMEGGSGNDILSGSMGNDRLGGGDGDDQLDGDSVVTLPPARLFTSWPVKETGNDILDGGAGNDTLTSRWGSDTLLGGAGDDLLVFNPKNWLTQEQPVDHRLVFDGGDGKDHFRIGGGYMSDAPDVVMTGGAGSDSFELEAPPDLASWTITDFQAGPGGDVLDIFELMGWVRQSPFATGHFRLEQRGLDTVVQYDSDGAGAWSSFTDLVTLENVARASLTRDNLRYGYEPDGKSVAVTPVAWGSAGADRLHGDAGANELHSGAGNDVLVGGAGNDLLRGGDGIDTAVYSGKLADYALRPGPNPELFVSELRAGAHDGKDRLFDVERLVFADTAFALDTWFGETAGQAYRIYRAAFDRTPDAGGVGFWIAMMDRGTTLADIARGFVRSQEFADLYGAAPTNAEIVTRMYTNILDRSPEQAGYDYWLAALDKKVIDVASMLAMFSESSENGWALLPLIGAGFSYQPFGG